MIHINIYISAKINGTSIFIIIPLSIIVNIAWRFYFLTASSWNILPWFKDFKHETSSHFCTFLDENWNCRYGRNKKWTGKLKYQSSSRLHDQYTSFDDYLFIQMIIYVIGQSELNLNFNNIIYIKNIHISLTLSI